MTEIILNISDISKKLNTNEISAMIHVADWIREKRIPFFACFTRKPNDNRTYVKYTLNNDDIALIFKMRWQ